MDIKTDIVCENCGKHINIVLLHEKNETPIAFCCWECLNEYRFYDGGDDDSLGLDCTTDTD